MPVYQDEKKMLTLACKGCWTHVNWYSTLSFLPKLDGYRGGIEIETPGELFKVTLESYWAWWDNRAAPALLDKSDPIGPVLEPLPDILRANGPKGID